jgi:hypothetical protein
MILTFPSPGVRKKVEADPLFPSVLGIPYGLNATPPKLAAAVTAQ